RARVAEVFPVAGRPGVAEAVAARFRVPLGAEIPARYAIPLESTTPAAGRAAPRTTPLPDVNKGGGMGWLCWALLASMESQAAQKASLSVLEFLAMIGASLLGVAAWLVVRHRSARQFVRQMRAFGTGTSPGP